MGAAENIQPQQMTAAEWQARCELAALYRICDHFGWTDILATHMSVRVPGEPNNFLINHYEEMFDEITASSLIKMDLEGNVIGKQGRFNSAGLTIHSGVYKARPDANCVMHTHTRAGAGLSMIHNGLRPISQDALLVYDAVVYHEYGMPATQEECDSLGISCQNGSCIILLNHGLLTLGETVQGTLSRMYRLERACELELIARSLGEPPVKVEQSVVDGIAEVMKKARQKPDFGLHDWNALVRAIDRKGTPYRR